MKDKLFTEKYEDEDNSGYSYKFDEDHCVPPLEDAKTDVGGVYKHYNNISLQDNIDKFCSKGGAFGNDTEFGERLRAGVQAAGSGVLGLYGFSEIGDKLSSFIFGGSSEFQNMPQEILKAQIRALDNAKDQALYQTICKSGQISVKLLKATKKLDVLVSTEIDALKQKVQFKIMELGIGQITLGILIISIVIFLLLY